MNKILPLIIAMPFLAGSFVGLHTDQDRVDSAVATLINDSFPDKAWRVRSSVRRVMAPTPLPDGQLLATFATPSANIPQGNAMVSLSTRDSAGRIDIVGKALVFFSVFDSVLVSTISIASGTIIDTAMFDATWRDVTRKGSDYLSLQEWNLLADRYGEVLSTRHIGANRLFRRSDLVPSPEVFIGDIVTMIAERNGIKISIACTAREKGSIGETIRVYSRDTRKTYRAKVVENANALWIETM